MEKGGRHRGGGETSGEEALKQALALPKASYRWIPEAQPTRRTVEINIQDYISETSQERPERFGKTIKMPTFERPEKKLDFQ